MLFYCNWSPFKLGFLFPVACSGLFKAKVYEVQRTGASQRRHVEKCPPDHIAKLLCYETESGEPFEGEAWHIMGPLRMLYKYGTP